MTKQTMKKIIEKTVTTLMMRLCEARSSEVSEPVRCGLFMNGDELDLTFWIKPASLIDSFVSE